MPRGLLLVLGLLIGACTSEPASSTATSSSDTGTESDSSSSDTGPDLPSDPTPDLPTQGGDDGDCEQLEQLVEALAQTPDPELSTALIESFVAEHSYGEHGFPLVEDQRLCVVYQGEDASEVSVAGDFNAWDPDATVLLSPLAGFGYAIVSLQAAPSGLYKLVHPGDNFLADPLARRHGWDEFGEYSQIDALPGRSHHERWPDFSEGIGELAPRDLTIWLPADADTGPTLPVIYMHDGQNLFAPDALFGGWQVSVTLDEAIETGVLAPVAIAAIDNTAARFDEYTQVGDVLDGSPLGGRANEYADFLVDGVMPFVQARYRVADDAAGSAVLGSSLGGLVSLYIGLRHPDRFAAIGSMSGTIVWGSIGAANPTILDDYLADPPVGMRMYLDSGGSEGEGCPEGGSDNYCGTVDLANVLRGFGWVDEHDLFYRWEPDAPHSEFAWAGRLLPALLDWFPGPARA